MRLDEIVSNLTRARAEARMCGATRQGRRSATGRDLCYETAFITSEYALASQLVESLIGHWPCRLQSIAMHRSEWKTCFYAKYPGYLPDRDKVIFEGLGQTRLLAVTLITLPYASLQFCSWKATCRLGTLDITACLCQA
ncbi:hypothetical protein KM043_013424 [Ampulex compressa]|nr:hypothetical protein KM043_013424 [Ampulex compressa]